MIGEVANAAYNCSKNFSPNETVYIRVHAYVKYPNQDWTRLGSEMLEVTAERAYETAGELARKMITHGLMGQITHAEKKAFKVVLDNGNGNICERNIGADYLPL